jgi:hypothetical protein
LTQHFEGKFDHFDFKEFIPYVGKFSDHSVQTDLRMPPHRQMFAFAREESDLPPQIPNHLLKNPKLAEKKVRIRSLEDPPRQRQSHSHVSIRDDGAPSQRSTAQGPVDLLHRPLWNYHNPQHREYVPNSKRDPHYDKRQRPQDRSSRIDEVPKKTSYNRWNSDSQLQHEQNEKKMNVGNRTRSMGMVKRKDEPIINVFKSQKPRQDTFVITTEENQQKFSNISSLDRYEHFTPYIRTDEVLDPARAFSPVPQSRETSAHRPPRATVSFYNDRAFFIYVFDRLFHMIIISDDKIRLFNHRLIMCLQLGKNIFFNN